MAEYIDKEKVNMSTYPEKKKTNDIKQIRETTGLSQSRFAEKFTIPLTNLQLWEQGRSNPPRYVSYMIKKILELESLLPAAGNSDEYK